MTRNILEIPNPDGQDSVVYDTILLERAPSVGAAPGAFAQIASFAIDANEEYTHYVDTGGVLTSWYRHRWQLASVQSDYSDPILYGDYTVRQWCVADIPDVDITILDWNRWRDQTIQHLSLYDLGRPADILSITPTSYTTEWYDLPSEIRTVTRVDIYDTSGYYATNTPQWEQRGRKIRIVEPNTQFVYKVYATAELRSMEDLDDELFTILYWGMRVKYLDRRIADRSNYRKHLGSTKGEEISTNQLLALKKDALAEFTYRVSKATASNSMPMPMS